ncbi:hypothetical protein ACNKF0_01885 [Nocardioides sp. T5]|uniref:hypothetical protein n=1 Tax=Nocardioides sp. T5 TaxID=3400182 RepID=UPI003A86DD43
MSPSSPRGHPTTWPTPWTGSVHSPPARRPGSAAADASSSTSPTTPSAPGGESPGSKASAPSTYDRLHEVLGDADVTLTPVLDLAQRRRVDAYEHPEVVKDHVWVQTGGDHFPFTPRTATRDGVDFDHAVPYDDTGPPGQTGPHNSGPLRRRHHRTKTYGGFTTRVVGPGRHLWRTPHGQAFLVDHTGTRRVPDHQASAMAEAIEDGVELHFTPTLLEYVPV